MNHFLLEKKKFSIIYNYNNYILFFNSVSEAKFNFSNFFITYNSEYWLFF